MSSIYHSVRLDGDKCLGCTTCLRNCPTGAIRVRDGKAKIIQTKCIDCGHCIRVCPYHAKISRTDPLSSIKNYKYKVALPAPTLIGQFQEKYSIDRILSALKKLGFDEVVEVAVGAELVGRALSREFSNPDRPRPIISSACPAVSKLIQVRFPELTKNITTLKSPMSVTARMVRKELVEQRGFENDDIGLFFITPCAAKATEIMDDEGDPFNRIDGAIAIRDVYGAIRAQLPTVEVEEGLHQAVWDGFRWALSGGESHFVAEDHKVIHVNGISHVTEVLEEIENGNLEEIEFFEGLACAGGCIGGCLTVENPFVAQMTIAGRVKAEKKQGIVPRDIEALVQKNHFDIYDNIYRKEPLEPRTFKPLDPDFGRAMEKLSEIEAIEKRLPGLDCGSCGAPGCRALAEDIVTGYAREIDCVFVLKEKVAALSRLTNEMLQS